MATSCGDLFMTDKNSKSFGSGILGASCAFDAKSFSRILEENIKGEILCLEQKIDMFIKFVKTDRPGFVSKKTLLDVLDTDIVDVGDEDIKPIIDSLFDLSFIIFGGENGYISEGDIKKIIDLLIFFNEKIYLNVYKYFINETALDFDRHTRARKKVFNGMALIKDKVKSLMNNDSQSRLDSINSEKFIINFFGKEEGQVEKVKSLMFLKKVLLGGEKYTLTNKETLDAIDKMPELMEVALDLVQAKNFIFKDELEKMFNLYNRDVKLLKNILFYDAEDSRKLFSLYDLFDSIEEIAPEFGNPDEELPGVDYSFHLRKYPREILEIKKILVVDQNESANFSNKDLNSFLNHASNHLDEAEFFFKMYDVYKDELNDPRPVSRDFSEYPTENSQESEFRDNFANIAYNYKYFKGNRKAPIFGHEYKRNASGMVEIRALEYLATEVMKTYGEEKNGARGGYHMELIPHVKPLIDKLKRLLRDVGLTKVGRSYKRDNDGNVLPFPEGDFAPEVTSTAENLVLMSTLFQNQSDGCKTKSGGPCMEVPEITEFLVGVLTALSVKESFNMLMQEECGDDVDEYGRFRVSCFREKFMTVLNKPYDSAGSRLSDSMPLLYSFTQELTENLPEGTSPTESSSYLKFVNETDAFTRTCNFTKNADGEQIDIPMTEDDAFGFFAGLLNVESTLLRFDVNENNKMDDGCDDRILRKYKICRKTSSEVNEVNNAYYEVYQSAIQGLVAPNGGFMLKLSKSIFQYLIKYGKVPDTSNFGSLWAYAKFLVRINKKADATRTSIATVLKTLGEQSANTKDYPFKCEECVVGDPSITCEPDDGISWEYDWNNQDL
jgi:hypothetical protein